MAASTRSNKQRFHGVAQHSRTTLGALSGTPVSDKLAATQDGDKASSSSHEKASTVASSASSQRAAAAATRRARPPSASDEQRRDRALRLEIAQLRDEKLAAQGASTAPATPCCRPATAPSATNLSDMAPNGPRLNGDDPLTRLSGKVLRVHRAPLHDGNMRPHLDAKDEPATMEVSLEYVDLLSWVAGETRRR